MVVTSTKNGMEVWLRLAAGAGADPGSNNDTQDYYQQHFLSSSAVAAPSSFKFPWPWITHQQQSIARLGKVRFSSQDARQFKAPLSEAAVGIASKLWYPAWRNHGSQQKPLIRSESSSEMRKYTYGLWGRIGFPGPSTKQLSDNRFII